MMLHWQGSCEERARTVDHVGRMLAQYGGVYVARHNSRTLETVAVAPRNRDAVLELVGAGWDGPR